MNPHGLPDPNHYTTPRDLATLAKHIIYDYPEQYKTYSEKSFMYNNIEQQNRNRLLWSDSTVDGLKTGHTSTAGFCLVVSAKRDDMRLISVVMGTASDRARTQETQKLLSYGYRFYKTTKLFTKDEKIAQARIWGGAKEQLDLVAEQDLFVTALRTNKEAIKTEQQINPYITAPIKKGDKLGEVTVTMQDGKIYKQSLVAAEDLESSGFFSRIWDMIHLFIFKMFAK
jgi:D-alanyl-D-alanine carboxypeptidase (penicillin-binding protein 5/6)